MLSIGPAPEPSKSIFFSVGEPSGDRHAAALIEELRAASSKLNFRGFGGPEMQAKGCSIDYELTNLAVVGFLEVAPKLREFFRVADQASEIFDANPPSAVVLVDFPGFNWHIAKRAKERGIPVYYYLPPQLWAWGSWRIKKIKKYVDHVFCNLPIERDWYLSKGVDVQYVGHPFFDDLNEEQLDSEFLEHWSNHEGLQVAILPGSRTREVSNIWPIQLAAIRELNQRHPTTRFLVACLKEAHKVQCQSQLLESDKGLNIEFFVDRTSEIIELADCSLMKSGSVSLEMMARGTPSVVVYHVSRALYEIGRRLTNLESMTLPNLISGETIMPEFLAVGRSTSDTIEKSVAAIDRLLGDPDERFLQRKRLFELNQQIGEPGASKRAAKFICESLEFAPNTQENSVAAHRAEAA